MVYRPKPRQTMTRHRRPERFALALALTLAGATAGAQPRRDDSEESREARQHSRRGAELQAAGRHEEAIEEFRLAGLGLMQPRYLALIGLNEAALNRWVDAYRHLEGALRFGTDPWIARNHSTLNTELERVRGHVGWVRLEGSPDGARLSINGTDAGTLPLTDNLLLPSDEPAQFELSAGGYVTDRRSVTVVARQTTPLQITLQALATEPAPVSQPQAEPATVAFEAPAPVVATPAPVTAVVTAPTTGDKTDYGRIVFWMGVGVGVAGSVATGVFLGLGGSAAAEYNDLCRGPSMAPASCVTFRTERQEQLDSYHTYALVGLSAALTGVAMALGGYIVPNREPRTPRNSLRPHLLLGASSVGLRVTW